MSVNHETIITHKVICDIYADDEPGPQAGKRWERQHYLDQGHDTDTHDTVIKLSDLPVGAIVSIRYPICPKCEELTPNDLTDENNQVIDHDHVCSCGFSWSDWVENEFM